MQAATSLLKAYRTHGHLAANVNPLGKEPKGDPALEPENLNLTPELMARIPARILRIGVEGETLLEALPRMRAAYCGTIAYQIEHLSSHQQRMWLREQIETGTHRVALTEAEKQQLRKRLAEVYGFERFIQKAYLGQKVFSIEGLDAIVPMIDELVSLAQRAGADEVVIGMAHRGRLSVLVNNLGRSVESILAEFEGAKALDQVKAIAALPQSGTGDVKYHHGAEGIVTTPDGEQIKVRLTRTQATSNSSTRWSPAAPGPPRPSTPGRAFITTPASRCRCCSTATRHSRRRASSPRRSTSRRSPATPPAAPSTSSPTTRWASPPTRRRGARPPTPATWRRASTSRSST